MNKWKVSFFITLAMLLASNVFWFYSAIDMGITFTYQQSSFDELERSHKFLGELVVMGGQEYSQKDILHLLRQIEPDAFIVEESNKIITNGVEFTFEGDRLIQAY